MVQDRPEHGMTKRSYVEAVLAGIQQAQATAQSKDLLPHAEANTCPTHAGI